MRLTKKVYLQVFLYTRGRGIGNTPGSDMDNRLCFLFSLQTDDAFWMDLSLTKMNLVSTTMRLE